MNRHRPLDFVWKKLPPTKRHHEMAGIDPQRGCERWYFIQQEFEFAILKHPNALIAQLASYFGPSLTDRRDRQSVREQSRQFGFFLGSASYAPQ